MMPRSSLGSSYSRCLNRADNLSSRRWTSCANHRTRSRFGRDHIKTAVNRGRLITEVGISMRQRIEMLREGLPCSIG